MPDWRRPPFRKISRLERNLSTKRRHGSNNPHPRKENNSTLYVEEKTNATRPKKWKPPSAILGENLTTYFKRNAKARKRIQKFEENREETSNYPKKIKSQLGQTAAYLIPTSQSNNFSSFQSNLSTNKQIKEPSATKKSYSPREDETTTVWERVTRMWISTLERLCDY